MLKSIIFFLFNTNIVIYIFLYILFEKISYYHVVVILDLDWIISDTKQQKFGISVIVVALFVTLWIYYLCYLRCDIYYYFYSDNTFFWISFVDKKK